MPAARGGGAGREAGLEAARRLRAHGELLVGCGAWWGAARRGAGCEAARRGARRRRTEEAGGVARGGGEPRVVREEVEHGVERLVDVTLGEGLGRTHALPAHRQLHTHAHLRRLGLRGMRAALDRPLGTPAIGQPPLRTIALRAGPLPFRPPAALVRLGVPLTPAGHGVARRAHAPLCGARARLLPPTVLPPAMLPPRRARLDAPGRCCPGFL